MKKWILVSMMVMVTTLSVVMPSITLADNGFAIGPAQLEVSVPANGSATCYVYITSHIDGELTVGTENLSFIVEPNTIVITPTDVSRKVALTVHGNDTLDAGDYAGKLTFLLRTGNNVAYGVKTKIDITQEGGGDTNPDDGLTDDVFQRNLFLILVVAGIVVALTMGILIGRRTRKPSD
ncbi:MAG: hypothetical protein NWF03_00545 [Candidatus Bathyarchaeota archaeon]|nr:hypothetical protein [Candidatus Bathyarchaeota archaeon]